MKLKAALLTLGKLAATVVLLLFVFTRVDVGEFLASMSGLQLVFALLCGTSVLSLQFVLGAVRLRLCVRLLGHDTTFGNGWTACQLGGFFSHAPGSIVVGDAMRIWHLSRTGVPLAEAAKAAVMDRAIGFVGMVLLVVITAPLFASVLPPGAARIGYFATVAAGITAAAAFGVLGFLRVEKTFGRWRSVVDFASISRYLWSNPRGAVKALALALVMNSLSAVAIWGIGLAYQARIGFPDAMVASPVVFLLALVPVSIAGWGIREGGFVVSLGVFGVASSIALSVSSTFGLAFLLASLPGAARFLSVRKRRSNKVILAIDHSK